MCVRVCVCVCVRVCVISIVVISSSGWWCDVSYVTPPTRFFVRQICSCS